MARLVSGMPSRPLVLVVASLSKVAFIALVLSHGTRFLRYEAGVAVFVDTVMVVAFLAYLIGTRRSSPSGS